MDELTNSSKVTEEKVQQFKQNLQDVQKFERLYKDSMEQTLKYRWEWMKNEAIVEGHHYLKFDKVRNKLVKIPDKQDSSVRMTINFTWMIYRAIKGFVLRVEPTWEVTPLGLEPTNLELAQQAGAFLRDIYVSQKIKTKVSEMMGDGLKCSIGVLLVSWDEQKGETYLRSIDPFDFFYDVNAIEADLSDASYVGHEFYISEQEVRSNPDYKVDKDKPLTGGEVSDNEENVFKKIRDQIIFKKRTDVKLSDEVGSLFKSGDDDNKTNPNKLIGREVYYKKYNDDGTYAIWVATWLKDGNELLRNEETDFEFFPYVIFHSDIRSRSLVGNGWIKHIIPMQKALNRLESLRFENNNLGQKIRFSASRQAQVETVSDHNGIRIEYNGFGFANKPTFINPPQVSPEVRTQSDDMKKAMQDIGGAHPEFLGTASFSGQSGRHAEVIQAGDANNTVDLRLNLQTTLEDLGYKLLWFYEKYGDKPIFFQVKKPDGNQEWKQAIGYEAFKEIRDTNEEDAQMYFPIIKSKVKVNMSSWLLFDEKTRFDMAKELYELQAIDKIALLETVQFGPISDILFREAKRMENQAMQTPMGQAASPQMPGNPEETIQPAPLPNQEVSQDGPEGESGAQEEIQMVLSGQIPEGFESGTPGATPEHTAVHIEFMNSSEAGVLTPEISELYLTHTAAEAEQNGMLEEVRQVIAANR